ncbi:FtsB family cell division protein [Glaciibacter psychrotolerans]|uniref:Cell division protein FtsB n=1 Tax=Glaciibacter psychrotolerans TaxID=670054 RepID=A0A7Z0EEP2_9MICO|nr:septum formation initiator family protein [Leifsonia psychrotolerans]NYJ19855.1 cell division protein FtsB [Leifsonia psychrotolerans]
MARSRAAKRAVALDDPATPAGGWLRGIRSSGFSLVMMGVLILAVVVLAPSLRIYAEQQQEISRLSAAVASQNATVAKLKSERERWNDRTYVTTQARDRLSYVLPGDINFLVINDVPLPAVVNAGIPPVSTEIQDTSVDWLASMFASAMTAGLAPEEPSP